MCGDIFGAVARAATARPAMPRSTTTYALGVEDHTSQPPRSSQVIARGAARCASKALGRQAEARGPARCASQVTERGAKAAARNASRFASRVFDRGAHAAARSAAR
jgi:hypothetical protein